MCHDILDLWVKFEIRECTGFINSLCLVIRDSHVLVHLIVWWLATVGKSPTELLSAIWFLNPCGVMCLW